MTSAQQDLLNVVSRYGHLGWCEVELEYASRRVAESTSDYLVPSIVKRVADACKRAGWLVDDDFPMLTEAGSQALVAAEGSR